MTKKKKSTEKIKNLRKFRITHTQGQDEFLAESVADADIKILEIFAQKGLTQKDRIDFEEVIE